MDDEKNEKMVMTQEECAERLLKATAATNKCIGEIEKRVCVLEEQMVGELGVIKTLQAMQQTLQQMRDSMNKQAWLLPLATAIITAMAVTIITRGL